MMQTIKPLVLASAVLVVGLVCFIVFNFYQQRLIAEKTDGLYVYWSNALEIARDQQQTVSEFVEEHGDRANIITQAPGSVLLRETIHMNILTCSEWSVEISFSWSGGDSSRFTRLAGKCSS